jgi:hypothetical protein
MKKLLFIPSLLGLLLLGSCQHSDSPMPTAAQLAAIGGADAEAMLIAADAMAPSGLEFANPFVFGIVVAGAGAVGSATYAHEIGVLFRNSNNDGRMLPSAYLLANNPYELLGIVHNKDLATYQNMASVFSEEMFEDDALLLQLILV